MENSIFLYINNDGDYDALYFEQNFNAQQVYEEMVTDGVTAKTLVVEDFGEEIEISVAIKEFGVVDPEFESFVKDSLCDYDQLKARDIFRVEPAV